MSQGNSARIYLREDRSESYCKKIPGVIFRLRLLDERYIQGAFERRHRPSRRFRLTKTSSSLSSDDVLVDTRFKASGSRPPATNNKSRSRARCSAGNSATRPLPSLGRRGRSGRGVVAAETLMGDGGDSLLSLLLAIGGVLEFGAKWAAN